MTDDLVKRARHNALADMPHYASVELIETMADRIEELEERLKAATDDAKAAEAYAEEIYAHTKKLEATELANRVAIMRLVVALRELKGDSDGQS